MSRIAEFERIRRRLFQNPNLMPETMYRMMNNADSLWFRMMYTPQLLEVIERNPIFSSIVNCNATFLLMAEAVIVFELIREMVRYIHRTGGAPTFPGNREMVMLCSNFTSDSNSRREQFMQNPTVLMIERFLLIQRALSRQISETPLNPQLAELMQNPSFIYHLQALEAMQQIVELVQSFVYQRGQQQSTRGASQTGGGTGNFFFSFSLMS